MSAVQRGIAGHQTGQQTVKYRITLAYDGTDYSGWQVQDNRITIQGVLNAALEKLDGAPVATHAAGRTDAGVHAEGQIVSFELSKDRDPNALLRALNGNLPRDIRVVEASIAPPDFHARFDARSKTYRYRIWNAEVSNPFLERFAWHFPFTLDFGKLREDAGRLVGTHDFSAFTIVDCEARTRIRTIDDVEIVRRGPLAEIFFRGDGFLRYQVRTMVGALLEANRGRLTAGTIEKLLSGGDRGQAGAPAPAKGLTLMKVEY